MRPVRYNVAASLDGFIADAHGAYDWIPDDPAIDFGALFARIDTVLIGRRTFELVRAQADAGASPAWSPGTRVYVFSDTLAPEAYPEVSIVPRHAASDTVAALRAEPGAGEIWLFGGGELFASLLSAGHVDRVEVTIAPVLLGRGVPVLPATGASAAPRAHLTLQHSQVYPSGMVALTYHVRRSPSV